MFSSCSVNVVGWTAALNLQGTCRETFSTKFKVLSKNFKFSFMKIRVKASHQQLMMTTGDHCYSLNFS